MSSNSSSGRFPKLVNVTTNEVHTLDSTSVTLGRAPDNQIVLPDDGYASAEHAKIYWQEGSWWLEDLMSSNGTTLNDKLLTAPSQLTPRDVIKVGRTTFRIE